MNVDYIALSIPVFFILIGVELLVSVIRKVRIYRFNDSLTNISLGIGQQVTGVFMKSALFFGYLWIYENTRIATIPTGIWTWIFLFLGVDFFYYWFHRMSHEVNALWAAHIVHHQSEDYNLSVALRQSWLQNAFSWVFYLPLAWVGFEPIMFLTVSSFNTLYQFWIHTRTIGRLGPLEWILNTPSHHRVHHGSDPVYLDKNHGGTLIIWDRLFGTFKEEAKEPHYGITKPLKSWNPVWANFHYWDDLFKMASRTSRFSDKVLVFLKPPGWRPADLGGQEIPQEIAESSYHKYDLHSDKRIHRYLFFQFVVVLLLATWVLFSVSLLSAYLLGLLSAWIVGSLAVFGAQFEQGKWARTGEITRLFTLVLLAAVPGFPANPAILLWSTGIFAAGSLFVYFRISSASMKNTAPGL